MKAVNSVNEIQLPPVTFTDKRGWVTNPFDAITFPTESLAFFHIVSTKPGHIRGNHYHNTTEWLLICSGKARLVWQAENSETSRSIDVTPPVMYEIPPNVTHAILNTGNEENLIISFSDSSERDTMRRVIVDSE